MKKPKTLPLFRIKGEFYDSLENYAQKALNLYMVCTTLIDLKLVSESHVPTLRKAVNEMLEAMTGDEEP